MEKICPSAWFTTAAEVAAHGLQGPSRGTPFPISQDTAPVDRRELLPATVMAVRSVDQRSVARNTYLGEIDADEQ